MAAFVAKQMLGSQIAAAKGSIPGTEEKPSEEEMEKAAEAERDRLEAIAEAEARRKEKHAKMEAERETMRQGIRDKYNIKKKEIPVEDADSDEPDNPLMRKKKTPEEIAAEAELEDADDFTKLKNTLETGVA